ncbi:MAG: class I SAM-dependent methyltransferase [Candidatus Promineifilaceae bacterium]
MSERLKEVYSRLSERYASGDIPWDDPLPPPEVLDFVSSLEVGRALDLGCGYGRASIYLATQGWAVDGVDFVEQALEVAQYRSKEAGVSVHFHLALITDLDFLNGPYNFALDVGCGHALDDEGLRLYKEQLCRLLAPGGYFMLFARMKEEAQHDDGESPSGLYEDKLLAVFEEGFTLTWAEHSETFLADGSSWPSAWFRFRRK